MQMNRFVSFLSKPGSQPLFANLFMPRVNTQVRRPLACLQGDVRYHASGRQRSGPRQRSPAGPNAPPATHVPVGKHHRRSRLTRLSSQKLRFILSERRSLTGASLAPKARSNCHRAYVYFAASVGHHRRRLYTTPLREVSGDSWGFSPISLHRLLFSATCRYAIKNWRKDLDLIDFEIHTFVRQDKFATEVRKNPESADEPQASRAETHVVTIV
jgi:hypothetical protein